MCSSYLKSAMFVFTGFRRDVTLRHQCLAALPTRKAACPRGYPILITMDKLVFDSIRSEINLSMKIHE